MSGVGAASAFAQIGSDILNAWVASSINDRNIAMTRETNFQNEKLMREAWARDDKARQRMVADLESAGLSKWLATGASPISSSPISLQSPSMSQNWHADGLAHMFQNLADVNQTEEQTEYIKTQKANAEVQKDVLEAEKDKQRAEARIAEHDAGVVESRPGVASSDPMYLKMLGEGKNQLDPNNPNGLRNYVINSLDKGLDYVPGGKELKKTGSWIKQKIKSYQEKRKTVKEKAIQKVKDSQRKAESKKRAESNREAKRYSGLNSKPISH